MAIIEELIKKWYKRIDSEWFLVPEFLQDLKSIKEYDTTTLNCYKCTCWINYIITWVNRTKLTHCEKCNKKIWKPNISIS